MANIRPLQPKFNASLVIMLIPPPTLTQVEQLERLFKSWGIMRDVKSCCAVSALRLCHVWGNKSQLLLNCDELSQYRNRRNNNLLELKSMSFISLYDFLKRYGEE